MDEAGSVLPVFEYAVHQSYQGLDWPGGLYAGAKVSVPLGPGLLGAVAETEAWVEVPRCGQTDASRYAQLTVRSPRYDTEPWTLRQRLATTLVAMTNRLRAASDCAGGGVLPQPQLAAPPAPAPVDPASLCGAETPPVIPTTGPTSPAARAWTQQRSGIDTYLEDCVISDGTPGAMPELRVEIYRDILGRLETSVLQRNSMAGQMYTTQLNNAYSTGYWGVCSGGPVVYRVEVKDIEQLPSSEALLTALIAANYPKDGCPLPRPSA
ncbi:hypothetical protein [Yinghuangia soli]|uniref:Uncharacterized protein n=1 Tax=Yinghuangia soli TaxID=2908204 RepID=A0AA41Q5J2_9ACTN|nr:hypothetical protein [Yinghuangia soli]MCF2531380.1 hypothetical protein [Yinghuangia soli]